MGVSIKSEAERINSILDYTQKSKNALGIMLGDKNGMRFTHIVNGRNSISKKLASDLTNLFPEISYDWLLTGRGDMLVNNEAKTAEDIYLGEGNDLEINKFLDVFFKFQNIIETSDRFKTYLNVKNQEAIIKYQHELLTKAQVLNNDKEE